MSIFEQVKNADLVACTGRAQGKGKVKMLTYNIALIFPFRSILLSRRDIKRSKLIDNKVHIDGLEFEFLKYGN